MSNVSGSALLSFVCVPVSPDTVMVAKLPAFEYKSTLTAIEMVKVFVEPGHGVDCTISLRIKAGLYTLRTEPSPGTEPGSYIEVGITYPTIFNDTNFSREKQSFLAQDFFCKPDYFTVGEGSFSI